MYPFRLVARVLIWAFCSSQTSRQVDIHAFETSLGAFKSSKALNQPLHDSIFGCIHVNPHCCHHKRDMLEKLLGYNNHSLSGGGVMEIRDSGTSFSVVTRSADEPSSDYIRGMRTMLNFAVFDSLFLPTFIGLPHMGPKMETVAVGMLLTLVLVATFVIHFSSCRQAAFYRLILVLSVSLSVRYWYTILMCTSGMLARLCPECTREVGQW